MNVVHTGRRGLNTKYDTGSFLALELASTTITGIGTFCHDEIHDEMVMTFPPKSNRSSCGRGRHGLSCHVLAPYCGPYTPPRGSSPQNGLGLLLSFPTGLLKTLEVSNLESINIYLEHTLEFSRGLE